MVRALIEGIYHLQDLQETPNWMTPLWTSIRPQSEISPLQDAGFKPYSGAVEGEFIHFMYGPRTAEFLVRNQALVFQDLKLNGAGDVTKLSPRIIAIADTVPVEQALFYALRTNHELNLKLDKKATPRQSRAAAELHVLHLLERFPQERKDYLKSRLVDMCSIANYIYKLFERHFTQERFIKGGEMKMLDILLQEYADEYTRFFRRLLGEEEGRGSEASHSYENGMTRSAQTVLPSLVY